MEFGAPGCRDACELYLLDLWLLGVYLNYAYCGSNLLSLPMSEPFLVPPLLVSFFLDDDAIGTFFKEFHLTWPRAAIVAVRA